MEAEAAVSYSLKISLVHKINVCFRLRRWRLVHRITDAVALNFESFHTLSEHVSAANAVVGLDYHFDIPSYDLHPLNNLMENVTTSMISSRLCPLIMVFVSNTAAVIVTSRHRSMNNALAGLLRSCIMIRVLPVLLG